MKIIEYKKSNKDLRNALIAEYFSFKFNINIDRRSIKNYYEKEELIKKHILRIQIVNLYQKTIKINGHEIKRIGRSCYITERFYYRKKTFKTKINFYICKI
ncbi:hypothetical protein DMUE_3000 [Dictyocoela muelleri]|nr:hypothetical protein DMUE_3000 [Dictyocoela muelleri]